MSEPPPAPRPERDGALRLWLLFGAVVWGAGAVEQRSVVGGVIAGVVILVILGSYVAGRRG